MATFEQTDELRKRQEEIAKERMIEGVQVIKSEKGKQEEIIRRRWKKKDMKTKAIHFENVSYDYNEENDALKINDCEPGFPQNA